MKRSGFFLIIFIAELLFNLALLSTGALADFVCSADVSYKWKRADEEKEQETNWAHLRHTAKDEEEGKAGVAEAGIREKVKAEAACKSDRENLAGCIAGKQAAMSAVSQNLGFSSRKALDDAIVKDCKQRQGTCLGAALGEAKCSEKKVDAAAAEGEEGKEGKAGEEKKGKK